MSYFIENWREYRKRCSLYMNHDDNEHLDLTYPQTKEWICLYRSSKQDGKVILPNIQHHQFNHELDRWCSLLINDSQKVEDIIHDIVYELQYELEQDGYQIKDIKQFKKDMTYFIYRLSSKDKDYDS